MILSFGKTFDFVPWSSIVFVSLTLNISIIFFTGCSQEKIVNILSKDKELLSYALPNVMSSVMTDAQGNLTIKIYEPANVGELVPVATVSPNAILTPASGTTLDFTDPVTYTITAQDGSSKTFTVTMELLLNGDKELLSYALPNNASNVMIDNDGNVIVRVYSFVDVAKLVPVITISPYATIFPKSGDMVDFTDPVTYTITAQDGSSKAFTVTIIKELSRQCEIISFTLNSTEQIFEREGDNIYIYVPYETNIENLSTNIVISDRATITPASGTTRNFSTPQIYTVTASDGTTKSYLVTVKKSPWKQVIKNGEAPFLPVDCHGLIVFKNKMWLLGGWLGAYNREKATYVVGSNYMTSQVWYTSDGIHWEGGGDAPWNGRHVNSVVYDDKLWIIGSDNVNANDIWNTEDGFNWTKVIDNAPWGQRYMPYVVSAQGKIWVIGGQKEALSGNLNGEKCNDVWTTTDGINWVREIEFARWAPRANILGHAVLNDNIYLIGGSAHYSAAYNDVWICSRGNWSLLTYQAEWSPRHWHNVATYNNKLWVIGGDINFTSLSNEVWYSGNGINWIQQKGVFWNPRHAAGAVEFNGKLWLIGGLVNPPNVKWGDVSNEVWAMEL